MHYWDTSTLVKLYVSEADSPQFATHLADTSAAITSELSRWEIFRVFARKEADGMIAAGAAEAVFKKFEADVVVGRITLLQMDDTVEARFRRLTLHLHRLTPPTFIRTLDAIHLATADLHSATEFVVADQNLRKCAAAIGLKVFPSPEFSHS